MDRIASRQDEERKRDILTGWTGSLRDRMKKESYINRIHRQDEERKREREKERKREREKERKRER